MKEEECVCVCMSVFVQHIELLMAPLSIDV